MKTPTSNKAGGTPPVKKVVKKTSAKAPVQSKHGMASEPAPVFKKEGVLEIAASQVKPVETKAQGPEVSVDLKADSLHSSKAPTDPRLVKLNGNNADERSAAIASDKPNKPTKPKIKTVIVKKKIVVPKKKVISAALPATEPIKTSSEANLVEKNSNVDKEAIKQQVASTGRDSTAKNPPAQETKPASLSPEKLQKGVRKTVIKGKGTTKEVKREPKQQKEVLLEISSEEPSDVSKGQKAKEAELLPEDDFREEVKSVEEDEVEEGGLMDTADEAMQLYDNQEAEVEEEPAYEHHDVEEEEGAAGGEDYHAEAMEQRPVTERQKRKKLEVFVGGLDKDATEDDLRAAFKPVGDVVEVRLMMNPMTGKNKGYAFVRFGNEEQAGRAVTEFAVTQIRGKECGVLPNQDNDTLFIGNISRDWRSSEVLQKLEEYGIDGIDDLTLIADPQNEAQNRGYAFLELATHYDAVNAFQRLQRPGVMFGYDRPPKVAWAQPLNEPDVSVMSQVKSVFVDGVPSNWTDDKVKQSFGQFGEIERIVFARNMAFAKRNDFAFVNFASRESALACTEAFREVELPDGDRKVKVKVSLARPSQKGRFDRWSIHGDYRDQGRGQAGRGEGWFRAPRFGSRRGGRGFGWSNGQGMTGRGGKRLYNEDEVLMLLRALREDEGWPSTTRGRGVRHTQVSRGTTRGAYFRNDESRQYDARRANTRSPDYRQQNDTGYTHGMYNRPASDLGTSRGRVSRPGAVRDDYEPQQQHHGGPSSRSRVAHSGHYLSPRHEGAHHQRYEEGHMHGRDGGGFAGEVQDYSDLSLGMKRPVSVWDEDSSYYESNQRGYPRARIDYSDPGPVPENVSQYPGRVRSPAGPATQAVGIRQGRAGLSAREGPVSSFYDSGSGLGKSGGSSAYDDHSYNTILPETSGYLSGAPERRETSMYSSSFYGEHSGSGGYDLQAPGYY